MIDEKGFKTYLFYVQGQKTVHRVSILENTKSVMTSCSCGGMQKCIHVLQVLSGDTANLQHESISQQAKMIARLSSTDEGKRIIRKASAYADFTECPECESKKIFRLNLILSVYNQIFFLKKARYKCSSCGFLW